MEGRTRRRRFSDEEVGEIIRLASRLDDAAYPDDGLDLLEVRRIADELGISEAAMTKAVTGHAVETRHARRRGRRRRLAGFVLEAHALLYATSMTGLAAIDIAEGGGFDFVHYPLFGWGIVLGWHAGLLWLLRRGPR